MNLTFINQNIYGYTFNNYFKFIRNNSSIVKAQFNARRFEKKNAEHQLRQILRQLRHATE